MKYIVFEDFGGKRVPLIFPERIGFAEMREQIPYSTVLSAGYVSLMADCTFHCHGESKELQASAAEGDGDLIASHFAEKD
ncbi:hypothetical protein [Desulfohalovibrio reitneri]|uniref:hypothetical protein n=1 Tax=Desulfohalovibrio reitneri TaxID=1307759 RepID=UPI0004A7135B|nr:hypothetical protein [Desulfohalovibrio reitneri]